MLIVNFIRPSAFMAILVFSALIASAPRLSAADAEISYTIISQEQAFEVRDYPALFVAEIAMPGQRDDILTAAGTVLSSYVDGNNLSRKKVETRKPVFHRLSAPLTSALPKATTKKSEFDQIWSVSFSLAGSGPLDAFPKPGDRRIDVIEHPPCRMAVLKFSGRWTDANLDQHRDELANLIKAKGLKPIGDPIFAFYDEFWQPYFWRHNEVLWEISPE